MGSSLCSKGMIKRSEHEGPLTWDLSEGVSLVMKGGPTMVGPNLGKFENYTPLDALKSHFKALFRIKSLKVLSKLRYKF